jgi:hypothetical protein
MKHFTPEQKHEILLEYTAYSPTHNFSALALRHSVHGGAQVVRCWYQRWNGTIASLQEKKKSGRPSILNGQEIFRHITTPIRRANRSGRIIRYTKITEGVRAKTRKSVSYSTIKRIGYKKLKVRKGRCNKRTPDECEYVSYIVHDFLFLSILHTHLSTWCSISMCIQCPKQHVRR